MRTTGSKGERSLIVQQMLRNGSTLPNEPGRHTAIDSVGYRGPGNHGSRQHDDTTIQHRAGHDDGPGKDHDVIFDPDRPRLVFEVRRIDVVPGRDECRSMADRTPSSDADGIPIVERHTAIDDAAGANLQ